MRTPERVAEAQRLRAEGLKWREIAERLGISLQAAQEWVTDPDGSRRDARKARYRGVCEECGGWTRGDGPGAAPKVCRSCLVIWTPEAVIAAISDWADEHGGVPPSQPCWMPSHPNSKPWQRAAYATGRWPSTPTVARAFGSWSAAILAAGFDVQVPQRGAWREWRDAILAGERTADIAERYGITPNAIHMSLNYHGLRIRELRKQAVAKDRDAA